MEYLKEDEQEMMCSKPNCTAPAHLNTRLLLSRLIEARKRVEGLELENRWIPVGERLPKIGQWVNVVWDGVVQRHAAMMDGDNSEEAIKEWWFDVDADPAPLNAITHWHPLLSPPPEGNACSCLPALPVSPDCKVHGMDKEGKNEG